jgi:hypothetical protein
LVVILFYFSRRHGDEAIPIDEMMPTSMFIVLQTNRSRYICKTIIYNLQTELDASDVSAMMALISI